MENTEQIMLINELACKNPKDFGYELSCWNLASLAKEAGRQGIVESVSIKNYALNLVYKLHGNASWDQKNHEPGHISCNPTPETIHKYAILSGISISGKEIPDRIAYFLKFF